MPMLEREGVKIAYEVTEAEARSAGAPVPTVVLLHNIFCDRRVFAEVATRLRPHCRTIAVDFRGHGESTLGEAPYAITDLVADVVAVLDREKVARAVVAGVSIGASVALELALAHPERVSRLVLMGADAEPDGGMASVRNALFCRLVPVFGMRWFILGGVTGTLFGKTFRADAGSQYPVWRAGIAAMDPRAAQRAMRAWTGRRPLLPALGTLAIPTRVVVGDEDVSCPLPCGEKVQQAVPGADLVRVPRAGHTMTAERPAEAAAAIHSFLDAS